MTQKHDYAMVLYIDEYIKAYNPKLGNITIYSNDNSDDYKASLRGDIVEFYTIHHKAKKHQSNDDNSLHIIGADKSWDEHMFVSNETLEKQKIEFAKQLTQKIER